MKKSKLILGLLLITIALAVYSIYPENRLTPGTEINKIVVLKAKRQMLVYSRGILLKSYQVSLGAESIGHKEFQGDKKTPEGIYYINDKNPNSGWHKNLGVSYPNKIDQLHAKKTGKSAGGDIKIHGMNKNTAFLGKFHRWFDWTLGCIAVTNEEIDELYQAVKIGTPIEIKP